MLVYRCLTQKEILIKFKETNEDFAAFKGANTHKYEKDISYIHFFKYKKSAEYYLNNNSSFFNPFILYMIADIPLDILKEHFGYGYYCYFDNNFKGTMLFPEYAIPRNIFKSEYIVDISTYINNFKDDNNIEYKKYLALFKSLIKQTNHNIDKIAKYLNNTNLDELLNNVSNEFYMENVNKELTKKRL